MLLASKRDAHLPCLVIAAALPFTATQRRLEYQYDLFYIQICVGGAFNLSHAARFFSRRRA